MRRLLPQRIATQLAGLVVLAVILANALATLTYLTFHQHGPRNNPAEVTGRLAGLIEMLDRTPGTARDTLLRQVQAAHPEFALGEAQAPAQGEPSPSSHLGRALGAGFMVISQPPRPGERQAHVIRLGDGRWLAASEPRPANPPFFGPQLVSLLMVALGVAALLVWSATRVVGPLQAMTRAVERFRPEARPEALRETGPYEIRALARAFNSLQGRIGELLTEKTNALAAVSHDLRTPITRMRLRAEFMSDTAERARMVHDLDLMDQMTQSALDHLRAVATGADREAVDLASLLHTLADRFQDMGQDVAVESAPRLVARVRPLDLERALENLIENSCKYATPPLLRLYEQAGQAVIEVEDRGPGIPESRREELMQPYTRGDHARGMNEAGGFGLGLAIAREAALRQGGTLSLLDARPQGLMVRLTLPLAA